MEADQMRVSFCKFTIKWWISSSSQPPPSPPISFRVMSFIEKSVARLDQLERLEALALELGKSHYHYNAPPKYYSVRPPCPSRAELQSGF